MFHRRAHTQAKDLPPTQAVRVNKGLIPPPCSQVPLRPFNRQIIQFEFSPT